MIRIIFVFPYRGQGGVPVVFAQLANYLSTQKLAICYIVDYADGLLSSLVDKSVISLCYSDHYILNLPGDSYVVMQAMTPWSIFPRISIHSSSKIFFWSLNPGNFALFTSKPLSRILAFLPSRFTSILFNSLYEQLRLFIELLVSHNSLAFMDNTCLDSVSKFSGINPTKSPLLAVPFSDSNNTTFTIKPLKPYLNLPLNVTWIGRVEDFKTFSLISFAYQLNDLALTNSLNVSLCVIGTGSDILMVTSTLNSLPYLDVTFIPNVDFNVLPEFLLSFTHVVYAMGTSALLAASLGLPTILAPLVYTKKVVSLRFNWIHDYDGFTLGEISDQNRQHHMRDLNSIYQELLSDFDALSSESALYVHRHHNISIISSHFLSLLASSSLEYDNPTLTKLIYKPFLYKVYNYFMHFLSN